MKNTKISWCDHTDNFWWGCSKAHTGCRNCFAEYKSDVRFKFDLWGENKLRKYIKSAFNNLEKYDKIGFETGIKQKVFIGSMMDIFEDSKPLLNPVGHSFWETGNVRSLLFQRIEMGFYQNIIFLFLTKRPQNIIKFIPESWKENPPVNVWFGTSISDQSTAIVYLNRLSSYKKYNLFLSIEPQIGVIQKIDLSNIKWVIKGCESGNNKRDFELQWAYIIKEMCEENNIPYFLKQIPINGKVTDNINDFPFELQIQQFPKF